MLVAVASAWVIGWAIGAAVVAVAALLLLAIIALGRRIARQAHEITAAIFASRDNTLPLFDVAATNHALDHIVRDLVSLRERSSR
jgi:hypothetical protein